MTKQRGFVVVVKGFAKIGVIHANMMPLTGSSSSMSFSIIGDMGNVVLLPDGYWRTSTILVV